MGSWVAVGQASSRLGLEMSGDAKETELPDVVG